MKIAIHQPDFFPWMGFFDKVMRVDALVIFDHVQISQGKSWSSRNQILLYDKVNWLTIPILRKGHSKQSIRETKINYSVAFARKHLGTLKQAYGKAPFFDEIFPCLVDLYERKFEFLTDFNQGFLRLILDKLGWNKELICSYDLLKNGQDELSLKGNALVLSICKKMNTSMYLSGTGCLDFILPESFKAEGIDFRFQDFNYPKYHQSSHNKDFIYPLSSLDPLFNLGFAGFKTLLEQNYD